MRILIVKHGAFGDVVRTAYFAGALRKKYGKDLQLTWITSKASLPLIRFNENIDDIFIEFPSLYGAEEFDLIFSLDDEEFAVEGVMNVPSKRIVGAKIGERGIVEYTEDSASWFDMGLLSRFGKKEADAKKKHNIRSHSEIFSEIFSVDDVRPEFWGNKRLENISREFFGVNCINIGINPWAGRRWPSKELPIGELIKLCGKLLAETKIVTSGGKLVLFGVGEDRLRNEEVAYRLSHDSVIVSNTEESLLKLASVIKSLDYLVTSDSLALHFAAAQRVRFLAYFSPTSAAEIDTFGLGTKVVSLSNDYCSYSPNADNSTITAERIVDAMRIHSPALFLKAYDHTVS